MEKEKYKIGVYIPTLGRADKLSVLSKNIHETTHNTHKIYFVVEPDDVDSIKAITDAGEAYIVNKSPGSHTGAANTVYRETSEPYFMIANDDFVFHEGWDTKALEKMKDKICVVGVNDTITDCLTIFLIKREYIQTQSGCVDVPDVVFYPEYHHNYVDTEFREVASMRGVFTKAPDSIVEHRHWTNGAKMDSTYQHSLKGDSADSRLYQSRRSLWT